LNLGKVHSEWGKSHSAAAGTSFLDSNQLNGPSLPLRHATVHATSLPPQEEIKCAKPHRHRTARGLGSSNPTGTSANWGNERQHCSTSCRPELLAAAATTTTTEPSRSGWSMQPCGS
jgi:hypothetical protein